MNILRVLLTLQVIRKGFLIHQVPHKYNGNNVQDKIEGNHHMKRNVTYIHLTLLQCQNYVKPNIKFTIYRGSVINYVVI